MDGSRKAEITMPEPLTESAFGRGQEPGCGQGHDENARGANHAADYHHSISGESLRQSSDQWRQNDDHPAIDICESSHRRTHPEHPITELREYIIHLQEDRFEEPDQQKKNE